MKYVKGEYYQIIFYDHCEGKDRYMVEVVAKVVDEDDTFVYLSYWNSIHDDPETVMDNHGWLSLVKSTVVEAYLLAF